MSEYHANQDRSTGMNPAQPDQARVNSLVFDQPSTQLDSSLGGYLRASLGLSLVALLLCGLLYSIVATGLGQLLFPQQANGSLITVNQKLVGSRLVAQPFVGDGYFHPRPSASNYSVMTMSGSNLALSNPELLKQIQQRQHAIAAKEHIPISSIPSDLVTSSGSGIDPEISLAAAELQIPRIAAQRQLSIEAVQALLMQQLQPPTWGMLGQARVNVLELNLALDQVNDRKP